MKIKNPLRIVLDRTVAHGLQPSARPSGTVARPVHTNLSSVARGHRAVGAHAVAQSARLAGGLPVDEVFPTTTGAPRGGAQARWGDEILTPTVGQ
jgi:hypothetical protein